jgi:hypothetical protein
LFLCLCTVLCISSCTGDSKPTGEQPTSPGIGPSASSTATSDEGTANEKLRLALESWQFGDSEEALKKKHPEIGRFSNFSAVTDYFPNTPKLQKFEITAGRRVTNSQPPTVSVFQFNVIHTFESKTGTELKRSHVYEVSADGKRWFIYAKLN